MIQKITINYFLFLFISLIFTIYFVGIDNYWFTNIDWLLGSADYTNSQLSWQYFKEDKWRFPFGKNPNYGMEISNSVVFTDTIPLFAFIFKILSIFNFEKIQYFSFWISICVFLQLFFSHKIIFKVTNSNSYALLGSFLLFLCPFFLMRLSHHFSLGGHWLILYAFYIGYCLDEKSKNLNWYILITLSLLIHLYFTAMIFIIYSSFLLEKVVSDKKISYLKSLVYKLFYTFFVMYLIGYFESNAVNSISSGYGEYKLDLFGFFDPQIDTGFNNLETSWSFFLGNIPDTGLEGFNYLGLGNLILLALTIFLFMLNFKKNIPAKDQLKLFRISNLYVLIFLFWSITTSPSIMNVPLINIKIHDYLYGALSIFSATGRFAWPVAYFVLFFSLFYIYRNFRKIYSFACVGFILLLQILDISIGIKNNAFEKLPNKKFDDFWNTIPKNYSSIRTTYLFNNYGPLFAEFSKILGNLENIKTDIVLNASLDRKKAAEVRYNLIDKISQNKIDKNVAYIVDNKGHLLQLKKTHRNNNTGFFFRNNFWIMLPDKKSEMTSIDKKLLEESTFSKIEPSKVYKNSFKNEYQGFGWTHNFNKEGSWTEGNNAYLLLRTPSSDKKLKFLFDVETYVSNKNKNYLLNILIDDELKKTINLGKESIKKINFDLDRKYINKEIMINFRLSGLISPFEKLESPDARKLGLLLKSFKIVEAK